MHEVDLETFSAAHEAGAVVIDVRDPCEFRSGHVDGAVNIPNGDLRARLYEVPRKVPVYLVCANGARSLESWSSSGQWGTTRTRWRVACSPGSPPVGR